MIAFRASVRVWLAVGRTDMRRGMHGLALQVQEVSTGAQKGPRIGVQKGPL